MSKEIVLGQAQIMDYLESEVDFPVDFENAWRWAGYSSKSTATRKLKASLRKT